MVFLAGTKRDLMTSEKKNTLLFLILGALLGGVFDILKFFQFSSPFIYTSLFFSFLFFALCYNAKHSLRLILSSLITAMVLCSPLLVNRLISQNHIDTVLLDLSIMSFIVGFPLFIYIGHCFHYGFHRENSWRIPYTTLFYAVWDSFVLLVTASIFSLIARLLILLAAAIFSSAGSHWLWQVYFHNVYVSTFINFLLFFLGLGIAQQNYTIIHNLRFLLLRMMHFFVPLLAIISIIYLFLYSFASTNLPASSFLSVELLIANLVGLGIVFFNAYFQTGEENPKQAVWLTILLSVYKLILFGLTLILNYLVLSKFSLPLNLSLLLLLAFLYGACYAISVFIPRNKQAAWIRAGNVGIALFYLAAMLLLNTFFYPLQQLIGFGSKPIINVVAPNAIQQAIHTSQLTSTLSIEDSKKTLDNQLQLHHLTWSDSLNAQAIKVEERNNQALFLCRAYYNKGYHIGSLSENICTITYAGKTVLVSDYKILSANDNAKVIWSSFASKKPPLPLGVESHAGQIRILYACRVTINNMPYIGKVVRNNCNIGLDSKEEKYPVEWVLSAFNPTLE